jgi:bifunctional DNase/RNase
MENVVEVTIDSIRVSLMSPHRVVILKDTTSDRYLPIWIGPCESDAITAELQGQTSPRPLTHDLLKSMISTLQAKVRHILISDLRDDVYFARVVMDQSGRSVEVDSRPSDAIALAVRVRVPIYVSDVVMDRAAITPDQEVEGEAPAPSVEPNDERLSIFKDFVDTLNFDDEDPDSKKD